MKKTCKILLCLLLVVLLAAAALTGCAKNPESPATEAPKTEAPATEAPKTEAPATEAPKTEAPATETAAPAEVQELGEGDKLFYFNVSFSDGETASYAIHTDAETVGEALVSLNLIAGENGEYAMTGVDATNIAEGATYAFVATAG